MRLLISGLAAAGGTGMADVGAARAQRLPPPPPPPPPAPVAEVLVDLSEQRLSAFDDAHRLLYRRLVSTGLPASPTPTGSFTVAARFASTPMTGRDYHIPNAICIHPAPWQEAAGQPFGVRRSHGCVRTSSATARWLFERTPLGTPVIIQP
jgi:lipoprotein-anchoring transpeptidase ErfK/SrfK